MCRLQGTVHRGDERKRGPMGSYLGDTVIFGRAPGYVRLARAVGLLVSIASVLTPSPNLLLFKWRRIKPLLWLSSRILATCTKSIMAAGLAWHYSSISRSVVMKPPLRSYHDEIEALPYNWLQLHCSERSLLTVSWGTDATRRPWRRTALASSYGGPMARGARQANHSSAPQLRYPEHYACTLPDTRR